MALIVETGSGSTTADAYISVSDSDTYHTEHSDSTDWSGATTAVKENAIRVATQYLDSKYKYSWKGRRSNQTQRLSWPRFDVQDEDGFVVPSDDLPRGLEDACAEAALLHITEANGLIPVESEPGVEREMVKVGPIESDITFSGTRSGLPKFNAVDFLLRDFIEAGGRVSRA